MNLSPGRAEPSTHREGVGAVPAQSGRRPGSFRPDDEECFGILVQVMVGPSDGPGEESFEVIVCTPEWLKSEIERIGPLSGRHHVIVGHWNSAQVHQYIRRVIESETGATWRELAEKISRFGWWEFEGCD